MDKYKARYKMKADISSLISFPTVSNFISTPPMPELCTHRPDKSSVHYQNWTFHAF